MTPWAHSLPCHQQHLGGRLVLRDTATVSLLGNMADGQCHPPPGLSFFMCNHTTDLIRLL